MHNAFPSATICYKVRIQSEKHNTYVVCIYNILYGHLWSFLSTVDAVMYAQVRYIYIYYIPFNNLVKDCKFSGCIIGYNTKQLTQKQLQHYMYYYNMNIFTSLVNL